ncbi:hypothetical protein KP509_35G046300 [Ceratopteris richardii]|uniref:Uncharacterized protein n=1 Tax=Ceratopteris richardii TaxID=49495 RepID=A0A8T2QF72_CERRI|nr:hypothetical protein KP509_35G046300 [Ceratopteris richardii]
MAYQTVGVIATAKVFISSDAHCSTQISFILCRWCLDNLICSNGKLHCLTLRFYRSVLHPKRMFSSPCAAIL